MCSNSWTHLHTFPAPWIPSVLWLFQVDILHMWSVRTPVDKTRPDRWRTAPARPMSRCPADTGLMGAIKVEPKLFIIHLCSMVYRQCFFNSYFASIKEKKIYQQFICHILQLQKARLFCL